MTESAEPTEIELIDSLLYLYILCGWLNMILGAIFLVIIVRNWKNASSATTPSQYNLRIKYLISLIVCVTNAFLYGAVIVFGITNTVIPWNYKTLPLIYQEVLIFFLLFTYVSMTFCMLLSFLFRVSILHHELSKLQSFMLNVFTAAFILLMAIVAGLVTHGGVNLGHFQDQSTGIGVLRSLEISAAYASKFVVLPLSAGGLILFAFIYSHQLKLLKQVSNKRERDTMMPIVLKESILVSIACTASTVTHSCIAFIPDDNLTLICSAYNVLALLCIFFMFRFNHRVFYMLCYYPSLLWLNVCCFHGKQKDDAQLLELQCSSKKGKYNVTKQEESEVDEDAEGVSDHDALNPNDV